jgi:hypothetical protein
MFVLCVVSKGKMQDNQDKARSKDEVQGTSEYKKEIAQGAWIFVLCVLYNKYKR